MSGTVTACAAVYICAGQTAHRARGTVASVKIETSITDAAITDWR
jgi:hypothetical protein